MYQELSLKEVINLFERTVGRFGEVETSFSPKVFASIEIWEYLNQFYKITGTLQEFDDEDAAEYNWLRNKWVVSRYFQDRLNLDFPGSYKEHKHLMRKAIKDIANASV